MNDIEIKDEKTFIEEFVDPFINSWNNLKNHSIQYGCKSLIDQSKGEKPLEITLFVTF